MKDELLNSLQAIRDEINSEKEKTSPCKIDSNFEGGILALDRLIIQIKENEIEFPCDHMLEGFNYYTSDSLPWTEGILAKIDTEYRKLRRLNILS